MDKLTGRGELEISLEGILKEFSPIPGLIRDVGPTNRAYDTNLLLQTATYNILANLVAENSIVYAPPKVGGQTLAATLIAHPSVPRLKHFHFMSSNGLAFLQSLIGKRSGHPNLHELQTAEAHGRWARVLVATNRFLRTRGLDSVIPKPIIVSAVREPMAQYLSLVFQLWWLYAEAPSHLTADGIRAGMLNDPWRHQCDNWFKDELKLSLGLDVFAKPFPTDLGWDIYENETARALVIRQENLGQVSVALGNLYGLDPSTFQVQSRNKAEDKDYNDCYEKVKAEWRPTEHEIEEVYSAPYVSHFYSQQEIQKFKARWLKGPARTTVGHAGPVKKDTSSAKKIPSKPTPKSKHACSPTPPPTDRGSHGWGCQPCDECQRRIGQAERQLSLVNSAKKLWPVRTLLSGRRKLLSMFRGRQKVA